MRFQADLAERLDPGAIGIPGNKNVNHANRRRKLFSVTAAHAVGSLEVADDELDGGLNSRHWIVLTVQAPLWKNGWNRSCPGRLAS
jgi:hypothetical protein